MAGQNRPEITIEMVSWPLGMKEKRSVEALMIWLDYKRLKKDQYVHPHSVNVLLMRFWKNGDIWSTGPVEAFCEAVDWSMSNNWRGLFHPNERSRNSAPQYGRAATSNASRFEEGSF